jgi:hypothetical protein
MRRIGCKNRIDRRLDCRRKIMAGERRTDVGESQALLAGLFNRQLLVLRGIVAVVSEMGNRVRISHLLRQQQQKRQQDGQECTLICHAMFRTYVSRLFLTTDGNPDFPGKSLHDSAFAADGRISNAVRMTKI